MRLDLLDRLHVDERPDHGTRLEPVGDLHRLGGFGQPVGEGVIDAVVHHYGVGAEAGLAAVAVFRGNRTPASEWGKLLTAISMSASSRATDKVLSRENDKPTKKHYMQKQLFTLRLVILAMTPN